MLRFVCLLIPALMMTLIADVADACPRCAPGVFSALGGAVSNARSRTRTVTRDDSQAAVTTLGVVPLAVAPVQAVPAPAASASASASAGAVATPPAVQGYYLPPQPAAPVTVQGGVGVTTLGVVALQAERKGPLERLRDRRGNKTVTVSSSNARTRVRSN